MAIAGKKMKPIDDEIARIDAEINRLQGERIGLLRAKELLEGGISAVESMITPRRRSPNIKPLVLDIMASAAHAGATSNDVDRIVRERVPTVAKDTVGSILSRLKADGALAYVGERYYEKRFAPENVRSFI